MKRKDRTPRFPSRKFFMGVLFAFILLGIGFGVLIFLFLRNANPEENLYDLVRSTATVLGVVTVGGAAAIQYRKQRFAEASAELDRDAKFAALLTTAINHLGSDSEAIRRGALYELKRLAYDSEKDRESAMEIIARFAKEKYNALSDKEKDKSLYTSEIELARDILCILLRDKSIIVDHTKLDLSFTPLAWGNLREADLRSANLGGAKLTLVHLDGAHLERAHLVGAHLDGAYLNEANLTHANLHFANLTNAFLRGADLSEADLTGAVVSVERLLFVLIDANTKLDPHIREELVRLKAKRDRLKAEKK